jgi:cbb3-type cytochrome oxidase maturation protein
MTIAGALILIVVLALTTTAAFAFAWAAASGQFSNFEKNARSIFDASEPVGEATDRFPDHEKKMDKL